MPCQTWCPAAVPEFTVSERLRSLKSVVGVSENGPLELLGLS
jgi:hypothetical protein